MKRIVLIVLIILPILFIKIPEYRELNNLKIIDTIGIDCQNNTIYLKEINPVRDDNGIEYEYKIYKYNNKTTHNDLHLYLKRVKKVITNCHNKNKRQSIKNVIYTKNIEKELRKKS